MSPGYPAVRLGGKFLCNIQLQQPPRELIPFCQIVDTNKTLHTLLRRDLNQKNGETIFLIWYKITLAVFLQHKLFGEGYRCFCRAVSI